MSNNEIITTNNNNGFGSNAVTLNEEANQESYSNAMVAVESSRAVAEIKASLFSAKQFPRNEITAYNRIMNACQRSGLAGDAIYEYSRGGSKISGASIRLAEAIALSWGNLDFGWRELERRKGESLIKAYCWDKETNTRREQDFTVKHTRDTKQGIKVLTDERDIYENNANMASRRLRACILACIPSDVVEDAIEQCNSTIKAQIEADSQTAAKMLKAFKEFGVNRAMIEAKIQRNFDAIEPAQILSLRKIYTSLKDGMSEVRNWFDISLSEEATTAQTEEPKAKAKEKASTAKTKSVQDFKAEQQNKVEEEITEDGEVIEPEMVCETEEAIREEENKIEDDSDVFPGDLPNK